MNTGLYLAPRK